MLGCVFKTINAILKGEAKKATHKKECKKDEEKTFTYVISTIDTKKTLNMIIIKIFILIINLFAFYRFALFILLCLYGVCLNGLRIYRF